MEQIQEKANYCLNCKIKPCQTGCPLQNDIPTFIKNVKEGNYSKAYEILQETTVLSSICGRICPHMSQCMGKCVRGIKGEPVSIGDLEAFVSDYAIEHGDSLLNCYADISKEEYKKNSEKSVAIVGSGPAGLTCAAFLRRYGFNVTIYEKHKELGGILRHGIPEFRLPKEILNKTIEQILYLDIAVKYEKELGKNLILEELQQKHDAIFLAIGANIPNKMNIEGENLNGVYGGNALLEFENGPSYIGKKVAIIGGGNVAMDCARTIKCKGAEKVVVIYRRAEEQMPAEKKEIEDAKKEGVEFLFQNNIVKILGNGKVEEIECIKTMLVKKEGESREVPVNIVGSNYKINIDYVVSAVGSKAEESVLEKLGIKLSEKGFILVNENYETSKENVYAGGDLIGQKATVAWAARAGREAAKQIAKKLKV